jgi:hypothetical protein
MKLQSRDVDLLIKEDWTLGGDCTSGASTLVPRTHNTNICTMKMNPFKKSSVITFTKGKYDASCLVLDCYVVRMWCHVVLWRLPIQQMVKERSRRVR